MKSPKAPKASKPTTLEGAARDALWFTASESKRVDLAKALAANDKGAIIKAAKESIKSVRCKVTKENLIKFLWP
jgi:hypothetical protein